MVKMRVIVWIPSKQVGGNGVLASTIASWFWKHLAFGRSVFKKVSLVLFSDCYLMVHSWSCKFLHLVMSGQHFSCSSLQTGISGARFSSTPLFQLRMRCTQYTRVTKCMHQCVLEVWMFSLQTLPKSPLQSTPETPFPGENWQGRGASSLYCNPCSNLHSFIADSFVKNRPDSHLYIHWLYHGNCFAEDIVWKHIRVSRVSRTHIFSWAQTAL